MTSGAQQSSRNWATSPNRTTIDQRTPGDNDLRKSALMATAGTLDRMVVVLLTSSLPVRGVGRVAVLVPCLIARHNVFINNHGSRTRIS